MFEKNASYLYVGNVARGTDTIAGMANGSIAVVDEAGTVQTSSIMATDANYRIVQKLADGTKVFSDYFNPAKLKGLTGKSYEAPVQKLSYIGYNGVSGSLDAAANTSYTFDVEWKNTAGYYNNSPLLEFAAYKSTAASQEEISLGLLDSFEAKMERAAFRFVETDRINNAAVTTANALDNDATVLKGSKSFTVATALAYNVGAGTLAVGDFVRIGTIGGGTALTSPVYKVTAINSLTVTVDRDITAASGTYATATDDLEVIPAGSIGANWGLKFVGQESSKFDAQVNSFSITDFDIMLGEGFTSATVTESTQAYIGIGHPKVLAIQEVYSQYLEKEPIISGYPRNNIRSEVDTTGTYDVISFEFTDAVVTWAGTGLTQSKGTKFTIATKVALDGDGVDAVFGFTL